MSEWSDEVSRFKQMLKVSAFYLEKQKSFIPKKKYKFLAIVSKHAKIIPKDGASHPNFQWRFWLALPLESSADKATAMCKRDERKTCLNSRKY